MNFWDSINTMLGYPPKEKEKGLWDELQSITDDSQGSPLNAGIQGASTLPIKAHKPSPYDVSADEINEIARSGKKAFQVFDINPFTLTYGRNKCLIDSRVIWNLIEYEPEIDASKTGGVQNILFSWRTQAIEVSGTWVKVEFLPARKNYSNTFNDYLGHNRADNKTLDYNPDQTPSEGFADVAGVNYNLPLNPNNKEDRNSSRQILIQFENPSSPVLIAKHGETFKLPFNKIFVSMRQMSPRIRITIGYNSEITNTENEALSNRDLALGPGNGLWNSPTMYPTPFTYSYLGDGQSTYNKVWDQTGVINYPEGQVKRVKNGVGIAWITEFSYSVTSLVVPANYEFIFTLNDSQILKEYYLKSGFLDRTVTVANGDVTFATPIRIVLGPSNNFSIESDVNTGIDATVTYSITGYTLGKARVIDPANNLTERYLQTLSENPYPEDFSISPLNDT